MTTRLSERYMNALLQAAYEGATKRGDNHDAQNVHERLYLMLTEQEDVEGQWWLTGYAKQVLAEIHERLRKCDGRGNELKDSVVYASLYTVYRGQKRFSGDDARDHFIAMRVSEVMYELRTSGEKPSPTKAARLVAETGEFENRKTGEKLDYKTIRNRFYKWNKWEKDFIGRDILATIIKAKETLNE